MLTNRTAPARATSSRLANLVPALMGSLVLLGGLVGCNSNDDNNNEDPPMDTGPGSTLNGIVTDGAADSIVALPASVDDRIEAVFARYTQFTAPNGSRIHFLSQAGVSDDLLIRTRGLVRQHLFDVPGTTLGADKSAAVNRASARSATFVLYENAASYDDLDADVIAFKAMFGDRLGDLDASTIVQEGSSSYAQPSPAFDPSIGATARFALEQGISGGIPAFQTALDAATTNAVTMSIYTPNGSTPAAEIDDEYLALALATYYGLFGHDPNGNGTSGLSQEYAVLDRADMQTADPMMFALIEDFFRPNHRYSAFLDTTFAGEFEMAFDIAIPYTYRSQYLERVGIRNPATTRINGNDLNNIFLGNTLGSTFEGKGGDDVIDAQAGTDIAIMSGPRAEYTITNLGNNVFEVADSVGGRDGTDQLRAITQVMFTDMTITL
ncbi:hypothetical protein Poly30_53740 [Planctomycetes bacterium Poly30]|uniref:Uncharacterized protein n=1 Tax=Saltatorellus ferox TaxID=2528018 RepID=A0A518F0E8_9BACT|nr:hypothetical protein Poly30_53740 [Planctomycetes bacterium Poly30]